MGLIGDPVDMQREYIRMRINMQRIYSNANLNIIRTGNIIRKMNNLARKIREIRKRAGLNQAEFADALGVSQGSISKWESGTETPTMQSFLKVAEFSGEDVSEIWLSEAHDLRPTHGDTIRVTGAIEAGAFGESVEWDPDDQFEVSIPLPQALRNYELFGSLVKGPSMNRLFPDGSLVFGIPTVKYGIAPAHGDIVFVTRKDKNGLYEATLKEFVKIGDGSVWLWPRSDHPDHQTPINIFGPRPEDIEEVAIAGIIVASFVLTNSRIEHLKDTGSN